MDLQKSKTLLDKINALFKNINGDPRNVSSIERDLMKSYVLHFYEAITEMPTVSSLNAPVPPQNLEAKPTEPKITLRRPEPAQVAPLQEPAPEPAKPPQPTPIPSPPPPPAVVMAVPEPAVEQAPVLPPPPIKPEPIVVAPPPAPPAPPAPVAVVQDFNGDPEMEELFSFKTATELSEKLSQLPIEDIKRAMGINERISTQNELFGGDANAFDSTVSTLNQLRSYEEAKKHLILHVANKYNWLSKEKKAKAKDFIKLVKRRY